MLCALDRNEIKNLFDTRANYLSRRSAAEVDELFERKVKPWRFSKSETTKQLSNEHELAKVEKSSVV
jgi:hypothetical protein